MVQVRPGTVGLKMGSKIFTRTGLQITSFFAVLLNLFANSGSYADEQEHRNVCLNLYYGALHRVRCTGDLYIPSGVTLAPVVILIHGGGWAAGDKSDCNMQELTNKLLAAGYAVFNVNYRLVQDGGRFPYNIQDIRNAISFIFSNAQEFGIDKRRIAIVGESAGGYLALMAGYGADRKLFLPRSEKGAGSVSCVVCYYPVTDLVNLDRGFVVEYLDDTESHNPELYKVAEPKNYMSTAVPTLIIHGTGDRVVPFENSQRFIQLLKQNQCEAELKIIDGAAHGFRSGAESESAFEATRAFLDSHLKRSSVSAHSAIP